MNNLNSVLIEGTFAEDPVIDSGCGHFVLVSNQVARRRDIPQEDDQADEVVLRFITTRIGVSVYGALVKSLKERGYKGRKARVVGSLAEADFITPAGLPGTSLVVIAEHIEFCPDFTRKDSANL